MWEFQEQEGQNENHRVVCKRCYILLQLLCHRCGYLWSFFCVLNSRVFLEVNYLVLRGRLLGWYQGHVHCKYLLGQICVVSNLERCVGLSLFDR